MENDAPRHFQTEHRKATSAWNETEKPIRGKCSVEGMNAKVVPFEMQNFQMTSHISQPTVVFDFTDTPGSVSVESAYAVDPIQRFRISAFMQQRCLTK